MRPNWLEVGQGVSATAGVDVGLAMAGVGPSVEVTGGGLAVGGCAVAVACGTSVDGRPAVGIGVDGREVAEA